MDNLAKLSRRIRMGITRAVLKLVNDKTGIQTAQISLFQNETKSNIERMQEYGFSSVPLPDCEGVAVFVGGTRDHGVIVATDDSRYRIKNQSPGEVAIYTDEGSSIKLKRGKIIEINGDDVIINANNFTVNAANHATFETPELKSSNDIRDNYSTNSSTIASDRVIYNTHTHDENDNGGPTDTPNNQMGS